MDGNGASSSLENFIYTCMNSVAQTSVAFISANVGAKNTRNIQRSVIYAAILAALIGITMGSIFVLLGPSLLGIYINNTQAIAIGLDRFTIICLSYCLCGIMEVLSYSLRGIGFSILPTIVSLCGVCSIRIIWVFTFFQKPFFHNLKGLSYSYPISWVITIIILLILYMTLRNKVFHQINEKKLSISNN